MTDRERFLDIYKKVQRCYGRSTKRLAGDAWPRDWQTVIATLLSAQSRDEVTIPIAEKLFTKYPSLLDLARAPEEDVLAILSSLNYNKTKARHVILAAQHLLSVHKGKVPQSMDALLKIPGVGRKTANLVLSEVFKQPSICVDTHVHRISNVLGLVDTRMPAQTERELMRIAPKRTWRHINRLFVLWGKSVPGRSKQRLLAALEIKATLK